MDCGAPKSMRLAATFRLLKESELGWRPVRGKGTGLGTYVAVEPFHLDRYADEQIFRYNNRATKDNPLTDADRFVLAVSQVVGRRLTYAELTGKVGETSEPF